MGGNAFMKLAKVLQPKQDHESVVKFRTLSRCRVTRWLVQRDVQAEERREQVVLEPRRGLAQRCGRRVRWHQLKKRLLRIQPGHNEGARVNLVPARQLNAAGAVILNENAPQFDAAPQLAAMLSDVGHE